MRLSVILVAAALPCPAVAADDSVQATVFGGGTHLSDHAGNHAVVGGGIAKRWGIEPELKVVRYTGDLGFTAVRYRAGVFFEFGK